MPKIIFEDEQTAMSSPAHDMSHRTSHRGGQFIVILLIVAFLMGGIGGTGALLLLSQSSSVRRYLGISESSPLNLTRTVSEKLVVEESNGFIDTAKKVSPAVVSITVKQTNVNFFGQQVESDAAGTGFIITSDGLIVTNKHVASDLNATYTVVTNDGKSYDATVKAQDPVEDLAFLKINAFGLPVVDLGDSDATEVGQWVVAIGNALGQFNNSVSVGVVSAKNRQLDAQGESNELTGLIQTDAAINPGNSGGPLVNLKGQVIGIDTAIASPTGSSVGIGFAIPINSVKKAIDSVRSGGTIQRPMLGVRYINIDPTVEQQLQLTVDHGALVHGDAQNLGIVPGGPAETAGIQEDDVILTLNGERIDSDHPLANLLVKYAPGDEVTLHILRKGKEMDVKVKLGTMKTS